MAQVGGFLEDFLNPPTQKSLEGVALSVWGGRGVSGFGFEGLQRS